MPVGTFDKKPTNKNTLCRVPIRARYSLVNGHIKKVECEYADVPLDVLGKYFARRLGVDIDTREIDKEDML